MSNPFDGDFGDLPKVKCSQPVKSYTSNRRQAECIDDDINYYDNQIEKYLQESKDSTERSLRNLDESEQVGVKTAQDLLEQREKLENAEHNLDKIQSTTGQTQRNLNSIKSVFGGIFKNKFSAKPKPPPAGPERRGNSKLEGAVGNLHASDKAGPMATTGPTLSESSREAIKGTRWEEMDNEIDSNLDEMSSNLARLQVLGSAMGDEIQDQNKMLDRIQDKATKNDVTIRDQDHQMKKILGYKPTKPVGDSTGLSGSYGKK